MSGAQDTLVRFRDGVALEPLVDGWAAWLLTMDPVTAGFFRRRHLEILLAFPDRHARAISDPRLTGGTFSDLAGVPQGDVEGYVEEYERHSAPYTSFPEALDEANALLAADPQRLPTPSELPAALRGHVEVVRSDAGFPALRVLRGPDADSVALSGRSGRTQTAARRSAAPLAWARTRRCRSPTRRSRSSKPWRS